MDTFSGILWRRKRSCACCTQLSFDWQWYPEQMVCSLDQDQQGILLEVEGGAKRDSLYSVLKKDSFYVDTFHDYFDLDWFVVLCSLLKPRLFFFLIWRSFCHILFHILLQGNNSDNWQTYIFHNTDIILGNKYITCIILVSLLCVILKYN